MKYGIEVEGRYKGIKSIFISMTELMSGVDFKMCPDGYNHIYISADYYPEESNDIIISLLEKYNVTIETSTLLNIREDVINLVHIMLVVDHPDIWSLNSLQSLHSIKFHSEDNDVLSTPLENMYSTKPADFEDDVYVK